MHQIDYAILAFYLAGMLALGFWISASITSFRDYFVVAGRMTVPLLISSLVSTYYGLDVLFGVSEIAYKEGVVAFFVYSRPYYIFILLAAFFVAKRLKQYDFLSLPDVVGHFYGNPTRFVVAGASFLYSLPIPTMMGIGVLGVVIFDIPFWVGVVIGSAISLVYTVAGGLMADAVTDSVQFALMCVTLGIATWIGVESVGGFDSMIARLPPSYLEPMGTYPMSIILVFSLTAVSALIEPGFYQRIFAAKSYKTVVWALVIGLGLWSAFDWATTTLGMVAQVSDFEITESKYALLEITLHLLPAGLSGLFVAGVLATAMSTIDSYLLIAGGNISYDIMRPLAKEPPSDERLLWTTRVATAAATVLAVTLALFFQSIVSAWVFMATLLISSALVPVMAGLYTSGPHSPKAGFLSSLFGLAVALLFYILVRSFGVHDPAWETTVIKLSVFGSELELWQEHALLFSLPAAIGGYLTGAFWERLKA